MSIEFKVRISAEKMKQIIPFAPMDRIQTFLPYLNDTMTKHEINTPLRQAAFLAQLAHESGSLKYTREIASGRAYEGRKDLGNTQPGDGVKYKGRGLIQVTGRFNYQKVSESLQVNFINSPYLLETPKYACESAGWYWSSKNLNALADDEDFRAITRVINGGYNGYKDRLEHYERAKKVLVG
jgi:putative chitinase